MEFYNKINNLLKEKRLKKTDISEKMTIPYSTIASMFQRKSSSVDLETLKKLANFFNVSIDYLLDNETNYISQFENITEEQKEAVKMLIELKQANFLKAYGYIYSLHAFQN